MSAILDYLKSSSFIESAIVVAVTYVLMVVIKKYLIKKVAYTTKGEQHQNTFIGVVFNILQYVVLIACIVIVLSINGVDVTSIFAGLGIGAAIIGLALQDTIKDIISGINIYNNNFYKVGDLVIYNGELCDVKYFNARVTKFTNYWTQNTVTVCNSLINSIEKVKNWTLILLYFDFEDDRKKIDKCWNTAIKKMEGTEYLEEIRYFGIADIDETGVKYGCIIICPGHKFLPIKMKFLTILYDEFKKNKISPSFNDERKLKMVKE